LEGDCKIVNCLLLRRGQRFGKCREFSGDRRASCFEHPRNRFPDEIKCKLDEIKWWNSDMDKLKAQAHLFTDIDKFISDYRI
jgi:hypothetical protein